ncbi:MAG TPA: hypothetical protein VGB36_10985 [Gammaproteobacteria bacterium]
MNDARRQQRVDLAALSLRARFGMHESLATLLPGAACEYQVRALSTGLSLRAMPHQVAHMTAEQ